MPVSCEKSWKASDNIILRESEERATEHFVIFLKTAQTSKKKSFDLHDVESKEPIITAVKIRYYYLNRINTNFKKSDKIS
jgi:hypothetical protein